MTTAPHNEPSTAMYTTEPGLFLAFALREKTWKLGCTTRWARPNDALASLQPPLWCVALKRAVQAAGCIAFGRRTGSPPQGWMPPPLRAIVASVAPRVMGWTCARC